MHESEPRVIRVPAGVSGAETPLIGPAKRHPWGGKHEKPEETMPSGVYERKPRKKAAAAEPASAPPQPKVGRGRRGPRAAAAVTSSPAVSVRVGAMTVEVSAEGPATVIRVSEARDGQS